MPTFGLIDGNSFYSSCERAFAPALNGRPVVVLSNNDGCAIARTAEAKALGIKMGAPWFKVRDQPALAGVEWFSSNYALYADMSRRMYDVLASRVPNVEPYSIDEMFLDLSEMPGDSGRVSAEASAVNAVRRIAKIPTCVGIGPTKTIANQANHVAKTREEFGGVCDLRVPDTRAAIYRDMPAGEVWGIGSKTAEKLERAGVSTIADFLDLDPKAARDMLTVVGARVQAELRGTSCLPLSLMSPQRKSLAVTRSFGRAVTRWDDIREAVSAYATRAGEKLRAHGLLAVSMVVFCHTNPHNDDPYYSGQRAARIEPTDDTTALIGEAARLLQAIWRPGFRYIKAGIMLNDLVLAAEQLPQLFATRDRVKSARMMAALDAVNARYGRDTLRPLAAGMARSWKAQQGNVSPRYTTNAGEMLAGRAV